MVFWVTTPVIIKGERIEINENIQCETSCGAERVYAEILKDKITL